MTTFKDICSFEIKHDFLLSFHRAFVCSEWRPKRLAHLRCLLQAIPRILSVNIKALNTNSLDTKFHSPSMPIKCLWKFFKATHNYNGIKQILKFDPETRWVYLHPQLQKNATIPKLRISELRSSEALTHARTLRWPLLQALDFNAQRDRTEDLYVSKETRLNF